MSARFGRAVEPFASPLAIVALAIPPLAVAVLAWRGVFDPREAAAAVSVRLWAGAAAAALVGWTIRALLHRRLTAAFAGCAALLLLGQALGSLLLQVDASADVGDGEEAVAWTATGPALRAVPPVSVLSIPTSGSQPVRLRVGGRELQLNGAAWSAAGGIEYSALGIFPAPAFTLRRIGGALEGEGYYKATPGGRGYFQVGLLPHRIYLTVNRTAAETPASPSERLKLRVQRGKVKVLEREVALGETVEFDGLAIRFTEGSRWVRLRARGSPRPWLLAAAVPFAVAAAWMARRGRLGGA